MEAAELRFAHVLQSHSPAISSPEVLPNVLHEHEIVSLQELRIGVLPYTFTNDKIKRIFNFQKEE